MGRRSRNECEIKGCSRDPYYSIRWNAAPEMEIRVCQDHEHRLLTEGYCTVTPIRDEDKDLLEDRTQPADELRTARCAPRTIRGLNDDGLLD